MNASSDEAQPRPEESMDRLDAALSRLAAADPDVDQLREALRAAQALAATEAEARARAEAQAATATAALETLRSSKSVRYTRSVRSAYSKVRKARPS